MKRTANFRVWVAFFSALLVAGAARSHPEPAVDTAALIRQSDTILIGIADVGHRRESRVATVKVQRVIKGREDLSGHRLQIALPADTGFASETDSEMFFLQCGASMHCTMSADDGAILPAGAGAPASSGSASDVERVARELVNVLAAHSAPMTDRLGELRLDRAVTALFTLSQEVVQPMLNDVAPCVMACAMALSAVKEQMGDYSGLKGIEPQMLNGGSALALLRKSVAVRMTFVSPLPDALVQPMTAWLRSRDVFVRRSGARVLSLIETRESVRPLAATAVFDSDQLVRYYAVSGLAAVAGKSVPRLDEYLADEQAYLPAWRVPAESHSIPPVR